MGDKKNPSSVTDIKSHKLTKRRLLKSLTATGVSVATAQRLMVEDVKGAASDQMVVSLDIDGESKYYVPKDWYDRLYQMYDVLDRMKERYTHKEGIAGVAGSAGERGGENPHVRVYLNSNSNKKEQRRGEIPEKVDGIEIQVEERDPPELAACTANCDNYDDQNLYPDIPGGVMVSVENGQCGTLTPLAIDINGTFAEDVLLTNAHVAGCSNTIGASVFHPDRDTGQKIGELVGYDSETDIAKIETTSTVSALDEVAQASDIDNGVRYEIGGTLTKNGVATFQNEGWFIHKQGTATCHTKGTIDAFGSDYNTFADCPGTIYNCVEWGTGNDLGDGDSGSITYGADPNSSEYFACNINSARYPLISVFGSAGYYIKERNNVYWNDGGD